MPVGDPPGWKRIFADDFLTPVPLGQFPSAVSSRWYAYPSTEVDTSGNGRYFPERGLSQHDGFLDIWLHTETIDGVATHIVEAPSPRLPTETGTSTSRLYGRYVVRYRAAVMPGYKTAWLLWPQSEVWPRDGEIDFPEAGLNGVSTITAAMHRQGATSGDDYDFFDTDTPNAGSGWHTAAVEWTARGCKFILDGSVIGSSSDRVPNTPMRWVLQSETSLSGTPPSDTVSGHILVDWVVVYAPS
jgi:Glycosyl hydrolases family 16